MLVRRLGLAVDDLELADDEDDGAERPRARRGSFEELTREAHGHVDDEVDDPVVVGREDVVARCVVLIGAGLHVLEVRLEVLLLLAVALEVEDRVDALARDDVVERKELLLEKLDDREDVIALARHDPEAQLVEDLRGDGLALGEELRVERIFVLPAPDELGDRKALREHTSDDAIDLLLDEVEDLLVGHREHEQQLTPIEMMDDVHALQDRARAGLAVTAAGRELEELFDRRLLDGLGDRVFEVAPEVADRLGLDRVHARAVGGLVGVELLGEEELGDLLGILEVQAVPVDDRVAAEEKPYSLEVGERELVDRLEAFAERHWRRRYLIPARSS